ncbi:MAG: carbohydrate ABC transporter permease [Gaiellaceae bacterium]
MSRLTPEGAAVASVAESGYIPASRRRRFSRRRLGHGAAPYVLLAPAAVVVGLVLAYPLYLLVRMSFEKYGLFELIRHQGRWVGTANYAHIFQDGQFWHVVLRTIAFTTVCVTLTMVLGTAIALLLVQVHRVIRVALTTGLVLVWAVPVIVAVDVWRWMVDYEFGVVNWVLSQLHFGHFARYDWFANPWTGFAIFTALIVWGAIPFVTITVYAALTQVPHELLEAASIDGARPWSVFREVTLPLLKPIFVILTSLSIIWDFQVFQQIWVMLDARPNSDYYTMAIYAFHESFQISEYGLGAAIAVVMVLFMFVATLLYLRQMLRTGEVN